MKKKIPVIVLALAVVAAGIYAYRSGFGRTPDNRILVSGNIELTEVNIAFKTAGRLIERTVDMYLAQFAPTARARRRKGTE